MKKAFNFRSVIICALVLILCLSAFVACDKDKGPQEPDLSGLENVKKLIHNMYKDKDGATATADFEVLNKYGDYTVEWTVTVTEGDQNGVKIVEGSKENYVKVQVDTKAAADIKFVLKATVKDNQGHSLAVGDGYNMTVPKYQAGSYEAIKKACDDGDKKTAYTFEGYIIGVNASIGSGYASGSLGSMWVMDDQGHGLYVYNAYKKDTNKLPSNLTTREAINEYYPVGAQVTVHGTVALSYDVYQFNSGATVTLTGKTAQSENVTLEYVDRTQMFGNAENDTDKALVETQSTRISLKNVVLGEKNGKEYSYSVNGKNFVFYNDQYLIDEATVSAIDTKWVVGAKANLKGIVNYYNKYQVYPDSADSVTILEQTDEETVDNVLSALEVPAEIADNFTLPTSDAVDKVEWSSNSANAVVNQETRLVTITRTDANQPVKFTVSVTKGSVTKSKDFNATIKAAEVVDPNTVILTTDSLKLQQKKYQESPEGGVTVNGVTFSFEEIGFYDAGIQTRNKNGKLSKIWNTTATNKPIAKLIVKLYDGKAGFSNKDTHTITFGNAVNGNAYSTTLSTVKDQYEYEIIPDAATYTFFTFAHNTSYTYTSFFESITIVYADEVVKTDQELVDEAKEALTLATTTTGVSFTLPTTGINGTTITWTSNNEAVIAINGENAVVTAPATVTPVTLTATIKLNEATATKTFDVTVTVTIPEFNVTINQPADGGTLAVTINDEAFTGGKVQQGKTLVIVPTAVDANHELVAILVNGTKLDAVEGVYSVTVNDAEVTITATFHEIKYVTVSIEETIANGSVTVKVGEDALDTTKQYRDGTVLTITATPANADYKLVEIKVNGTAITGTTYTIAETDTEVVITATFAEKYPAMSIADFKASETAKGTQVKLTGVVTSVDKKAAYFQDKNGQAVYVFFGYVAPYSDTLKDIVIGKEYTFAGEKDDHNGLVQLKSPVVIGEARDPEYQVTAKEVDETAYNALTLANTAELLTLRNLVVTNGKWMLGETEVKYYAGNANDANKKAVDERIALLANGVKFDLVGVNFTYNKPKNADGFFQVAVDRAEVVVIDWQPVATVDLAEIAVNGTAKITVTANPAVTTDVKAEFVSENENATVDKNGVVTGVKAGPVVIAVTANGHTVKVELTVKETVDEYTVNYTKTVEGANGSIASVMAGETAVEPGTKVVKGTKVTVTVTPAEGYQLASYTLNAGEAVAAKGQTSFDVTVTENVTIAVTFEVKPANVTVTKTIAEIATENGWKNETKYTSIDMGEVTVSLTGKTNTGKYYTNGNEWRTYQTESPAITISAKEGYKVVSVKITYSVGKTGVLLNGTAQVKSGTVVTVDAQSITFGVGNTGSATNGQVKITAIEVVYAAA